MKRRAELFYFEDNVVHRSRIEEKKVGRGRSLLRVRHVLAAVFISFNSHHFALCGKALYLHFSNENTEPEKN